MANNILRIPALTKRLGMARSTIYLRMKQGDFPKPIKLGPRMVGWLEADVEHWLEKQIIASQGK